MASHGPVCFLLVSLRSLDNVRQVVELEPAVAAVSRLTPGVLALILAVESVA